MNIETINVDVDLKEYFKKMSSKDSAEIISMCLDKLCDKAEELKDLYRQLVTSYGIEMGLSDVTLLVQVSSPKLSVIPVRGMLGTDNGIKHALVVMMGNGLGDLAKMKEEDSNDKKQG